MKFPRHWIFISHTFLYSILALTDEFLLEILCTLLVSQNICMYSSLNMSFFFFFLGITVQIHHILQCFDFSIKNMTIRGISRTRLNFFPWFQKYLCIYRLIYAPDFPFSPYVYLSPWNSSFLFAWRHHLKEN